MTSTPQQGNFPPSGPTTVTQTIPAYLYKEYDDDPSMQSFFAAFNGFAGGYVSWFANTPLPVYTSSQITGALLDWTAAGIYQILRPSLSSGVFRSVGPFDTFAYNTWPFNKIKLVGPKNVTVTTDDIYKRILTWNLYRGDGTRFNIRWLKRRILRFLIGPNGTAPNIDETYPVSVTFGNNGLVSIRISAGSRIITGGSLYNRFGFNAKGMPFNSLNTVFVSAPNPFPNATVLKQAMDGSALQLPFQFTFQITVPTD